MSVLIFALLCGLLAVAYGVWASRSVLSANAGTARMQEIAAAIQVGASAYLNRQYTTIGIVGIVIALLVSFLLGWRVGLGFLVGAVLSGTAGYIGMHISVRANVRPAAAASPGLACRLALAFSPGAFPDTLVPGL